MKEAQRFDNIASKYVIPFLRGPIVHDCLVLLSSDRDAWLENEMVLVSGAQPCFMLDNGSYLSWPELITAHRSRLSEDGSLPLRCRDFLQSSNLLLALSRVVDVLSSPTSKSQSVTLVSFLKSAEGQLGFLSPLTRIAILYNDLQVGQKIPMGRGALLATRTLNHLVARILQYVPAEHYLERVDAALQIIARILPGDEDLFESLIEGILKPSETGGAPSLLHSSNTQILEFFKEIAAIRAVADDDFQEDDEDQFAHGSAKLPVAEDEDMMRPGFSIPTDRSLLPLGRTWLYSPIRRFKEFDALAAAQDEDNQITEKQQEVASIKFARDAIALVHSLESTGKLKCSCWPDSDPGTDFGLSFSYGFYHS